jgi:hypothetical protein
MSEPIFTINAPGVDVSRIVEEVKTSVAEKRASGFYADARTAIAERTNLANLKNEDEFLSFYLECLRDAVFVDINDFEIVERRGTLSGLFIALKKVIWKLLKFYTYRLWSQQNQVNALLLSAMEAQESRNREKIKELEERIAKLESGNAARR